MKSIWIEVTLCMIVGVCILRGQTNTFPSSGNVGIGTTAPQAALHVSETGSTNLDWIGILNNPNNSPNSGYGVGLRLQNSTIGGGPNEAYKWAGIAAVAEGQWSNNTDLAFYTGNFNAGANATSQPTERMRIQSTTGNVGIGTTDPCTNPQAPSNCKLSVAGAIQAYEVLVNNQWSDYVFQPGYRLRPLKEVAAYIAENHHLPDIPSEAEVKQKGIGVGEMEAKLLAKVEELTLHMIQAEQENRELKERVAQLEREARSGGVK
jgi:hypothetical protein